MQHRWLLIVPLALLAVAMIVAIASVLPLPARQTVSGPDDSVRVELMAEFDGVRLYRFREPNRIFSRYHYLALRGDSVTLGVSP